MHNSLLLLSRGAHREGTAVDPAIPLDRYGQVLADYLKSPGDLPLETDWRGDLGRVGACDGRCHVLVAQPT